MGGHPPATFVPNGRLRVLHIIDNLNLGGTERQLYEIVVHLDRATFESQVVAFNTEGPYLRKLIEADIPVLGLPFSNSVYHPGSLAQILRLARRMKEKTAQIVQCYGYYSNVPGIAAAKMAGVPVIVAGKRDLNDSLTGTKIFLEKLLLRLSDKIIVNSASVKGYLTGHVGIQEQRIEIVYNGIDLRKYPELTDAPREEVVGMIGNFRPPKDHLTFIEAAAVAARNRPEMRFVLVGSGPLEAQMKERADALGMGDRIVFAGRKEGEDLIRLMSSFTVSVMASASEGMPNAVLEAMALGLPVIANPVGGIPEMIEDGVNGVLFPFKRPDILAEKILALSAHPVQARVMGRRARQKVQECFTTDIMIRRLKDLYQTLYLLKRGRHSDAPIPSEEGLMSNRNPREGD